MQDAGIQFGRSAGPVFLAASVPRTHALSTPEQEIEAGLIRSAVMALTHAVLGKRLLVWGGHPSITPIISLVARAQGIKVESWTRLYQSCHFSESQIRENRYFGNVVFTPDLGSPEASIIEMRRQMVSDLDFDAAVFLGGGQGVKAEFDLIRRSQPQTRIIPVASTGRAALDIFNAGDYPQRLKTDCNYSALFGDMFEVEAAGPIEPWACHPPDRPCHPSSRTGPG